MEHHSHHPIRRFLRIAGIPLLILAAALIFTVAILLDSQMPPIAEDTLPTADTTVYTEPSAPTTVPTEPPVTKESTFTLAATGDLLMHVAVMDSAKVSGGYNFDSIFTFFQDYVGAADLAAANLETTLASNDNGYQYKGYPRFNCPDEIVDGAKAAGFDLLLTANNHAYDTSTTGLTRTVDVIREKGLLYLGTKDTADEPNYLVAEHGGIRLGLMCYTYETNSDPDKKAPNGLTMKTADAPLMNTFDYTNLEMFYQEVRESLAQMARQGVDATVLFIHWGNEYQTKQNKSQTAIAQALCDLGVDVIIGGHPHVVQPVDLLTSTKDENHKTVCLYSMGNAVSNQRRAKMNLKTGHTEDGVLFSVTFARYTDGTVILESADLLPTWVNLDTHPETGKKAYMILPLDNAVTDWKAAFGLSDNTLKNAEASYERTVKITGEGMTKVNTWLAQNQTDTETAIGVEK